MSSVEHAKHELLNYARLHDAERAQRARPMRAALVTAGALILASRVLGAVRRAPGGGLVGGLVAVRLAIKYGPVLAEGIRQARRAYHRAVAHNNGVAGGAPTSVSTRRLPPVVVAAGDPAGETVPAHAGLDAS